MATNQSYLLAETMEERVAIGVINFLATWHAERGEESPVLPNIDQCAKFIKPYIIKEVLVRVFGELNFKEQTVQERQTVTANGIMVAASEIQKGLRPEYL